mgnify:FL=1
MLVTLHEVMEIAEREKIAIGAFNTPNLECLQAVIGAAEELQLPVIAQFAECHEPWNPLDDLGPIIVMLAEKASVPVCVNLDHGETVAYIEKALKIGFTSVMYDGSVLPYEENLKNTQLVVEMAKKTGASVEAELGTMGKRESGSGDHESEHDDSKIYTDPQVAKDFVKSSHVDALACSFGTTHGIYLTEPKLDFSVVSDVRTLTDKTPIVMHGGSGVSEADYRKAVEAGVRKINYFTYMDKSGGEEAANYVKALAADEPIFFSQISMAARDAMKENVKKAMKIFAGRN